MTLTQKLEDCIDAEFSSMKAKREKFQTEETQKHQQWQQRLTRLGNVFDSLREVWKPRLEVLIQKFGDKVSGSPKLTPSTRSIELEFQSDVAKVELRFEATTDFELTKVILNYDLRIIPILMQFESHAELEMPVEKVDREAVGRWMDARILSFVKTYVSLHENPFYVRDQMVEDPVTGTRFPKFIAGAKLERDGKTFYFVSEETRRQFEKKAASKVN